MNNKNEASNFKDDVLFNIFLLIPIEILHKTMKLVCRQWRRMVKNKVFIRQHLLNSDLIILKQINHDHAFSRCNIEIQNNPVIKAVNHLHLPGKVLSSIDGLLMFSNRHNGTLYVSNPLTNEVVKLPSCPSILDTRHQVTLVPVVSAMEYKLVARYLSSDSRALYVYTTSIGRQDESWKRIDHNYPNDVGMKIPEQFEVSGIAVEGFLFWAKQNCRSYIISLDMKTEKFVEFPAPAVDHGVKDVYYMKMKNKLSCIHDEGQTRNWAVYLLQVSRKTGNYQWSKIYSFNWSSKYLVPLGWTANCEVLIFRSECYNTHLKAYAHLKHSIVALDVVSRSTTCFTYEGVNTPGYSWQLPHVDSLVSLVSLN